MLSDETAGRLQNPLEELRQALLSRDRRDQQDKAIRMLAALQGHVSKGLERMAAERAQDEPETEETETEQAEPTVEMSPGRVFYPCDRAEWESMTSPYEWIDLICRLVLGGSYDAHEQSLSIGRLLEKWFPSMSQEDPDGLYEPNVLRWKGSPYELQTIHWRLMRAMWDHDSRPISDVVSEVWGNEVPDSTLKPALSKLNNKLLEIGCPISLGSKGGYLVKDIAE